MGQQQTTRRKSNDPAAAGFDAVIPSHSSASSATSNKQLPLSSLPPTAAVQNNAPTAIAPLASVPAHAITSTTESSNMLLDAPESVRKSRTMEKFEHICSEILPNLLFISNLTVAQNESRLQPLGITHIINCCAEICISPRERTEKYVTLAVRDGVQEDLLPFFYQVSDLIEHCRRHNQQSTSTPQRVLIHCHQGISRSCALATAYVMFHQQLSCHEALAFVKSKRPIAAPNSAFLCQLIEWERLVVHNTGDASFLYRLAPHAAYDPSTWVLKLCYQAPESRTPIDLTANTPILWSKGLFVFQRGEEIVISRGKHCHEWIPEDVTTTHVRALLHQMLRIHLRSYDDKLSALVIEEEREQSASDDDDLALWKVYRDEAQFHPASVPAPATRIESHQEDENDTPSLFLLDETQQWEHLRSYDADDLTCDDVLLLLDATSAFLWIGRSSTMDQSTARTLAQSKMSVSIEIVLQDQEPESFWEVFERGY